MNILTCVDLAEISVVVVDTDEKCNQLLDRSPKCLRRIIVIRGTRPSTNQKARNRGVELLSFDEVERAGTSKTHPEQVNMIINTLRVVYSHLLSKIATETHRFMHDMLHFRHYGIAQRSDADPWQCSSSCQCRASATFPLQTECR